MANIMKPDCGWDRYFSEIPKVVTSAEVTDSDGWDLTAVTNATYTYPDTAVAAIEITSLENMVPGKKYSLTVVNAATTALVVTFPNTVLTEKPAVQDAAASDPITLEEADIANGDTVVYEFWTDGTNTFLSRKLFA